MRLSRPTSRAPLALLIAMLGACASSGTYVPTPEPVRPLELTIVRPETGRLLVQTNRRSYLTVFEIVPGRGVSLVYPATMHQGTVNGGMHWLPIAWTTPGGIIERILVRRGADVHYAYAIASDVPLDITEDAYDPAYMQRALGVVAYRAVNPAATMRAIAQRFVPPIDMDQWSEDSYQIEETEETRVVRVYCPDGSSVDVREAIVGRVRCSTRPPAVARTQPTPAPRTPRPVGGTTADAPVVQSGSTTPVITPRPAPPVLRFPTPSSNATDSAATGRGNGNGNGNQNNGHQDNGNHGNGNNGNHGQGNNGQGDDDARGRDSSRGRGGFGGLPRGRGLGQGIGAPRNDPKSPEIGDANPKPDHPQTPASGNANDHANGSSSANASSNASSTGTANGNASGSKKEEPKPAEQSKEKPKGMRGWVRAATDTTSKKP